MTAPGRLAELAELARLRVTASDCDDLVSLALSLANIQRAYDNAISAVDDIVDPGTPEWVQGVDAIGIMKAERDRLLDALAEKHRLIERRAAGAAAAL